ncbi:hypothetical protein [Hydrogenothermus marinus]|uniref:Uncharacterized protein n=1 Tax=Hydrogenothermus marinus TaxID=133270 RepID=A0A3M0C2X6_9AQUI|nr:hypothetical protein [Hydrogenothermus marinus]RMA97302.1 hypothetical protein CLV39_0960 [Hydrogenothermus marinus]
MKLQNLILNKLGNNFSVLISNPEIQIMEKVRSGVNIDNQNLYFEIDGISTMNFDNTILQIYLKLYSPKFEYESYIKFFEDGRIFAFATEEFIGDFKEGIFSLEMVEEDPAMIFKLSGIKPTYFTFEKEDKYKVKIKEEHLIKGVLEITYFLKK